MRTPRRDDQILILSDGSNRRFQFHESAQLFIRSHHETLSVVAVRICNKDCSPVGIRCCNTAPTPTSLTEIVSDDLPILHTGMDSGPAALLIVENDLPGSFIDFKLCADFLNL